MPKGMQPIYTINVGTGGTSSITFNSIPQNYTDLIVNLSLRTAWSSNNWDDIFVEINGGAPAVNSPTTMYGIAAGATSARGTAGTTMWCGWGSNANSTANTFGSSYMYIPNYSQTGFKQVITDTATEGNSASQVFGMIGLAHRSNAPITSMRFFSSNSSTILQHSSINLYGISR